MPGASLWLVPPPTSPLHASLSTLITTRVPAIYHAPDSSSSSAPPPPPTFPPHITLTSGVSVPSLPDGEQEQQWLDNLALPPDIDDGLILELKGVEAGEIFFRKLTLRVEKNGALRDLALACRVEGTGCTAEEARGWVEGEFAPHLSLL